MKLNDFLKQQQKTWKLKDWFWWYWYGFTTRLSVKTYPLIKLYCRVFGHSGKIGDECERCGVDL